MRLDGPRGAGWLNPHRTLARHRTMAGYVDARPSNNNTTTTHGGFAIIQGFSESALQPSKYKWAMHTCLMTVGDSANKAKGNLERASNKLRA